MAPRSNILLKLTGEFLVTDGNDNCIDSSRVRDLARQVKSLESTHFFGIVVGGGNFFRGTKEGASLGMSANTSDSVGMLATLMNGLILQDVFMQEGINTTLFSSFESPTIANAISPQALSTALATKDCVLFGGGMGNPFFTTDTTAIIRGLQIQAHEVWKATKVDGIYTGDPFTDASARRLPTLTYTDALKENLRIMDETAFALARQHKLNVRVFSLFEDDALIKAARDKTFGSRLTP